MDRTILHCDLNNFYASVACRDHPELRNKAVAVTGSEEQRHGIVLAKNMAAKKCGVQTGETIRDAKRKCPDLVCVPPEFERYNHFSRLARGIYEQYSDMVEPFGPDEAWIDVTGSRVLFGDGERIANEIRNRIKRELGLTISVGVSFNKVFAKMGSDLKKPDAVSVITRENFREVIWSLPVESMIGIGRSTKLKLNSMGIYTLGELSNAATDGLKKNLGVLGPQMQENARGNDVSRVAAATYNRVPGSLGRSTTYHVDICTYADVWRVMLKLSEEVGMQLRSHKLEAMGVQIHLRTNQLKVNELQAPLRRPTSSGLLLCEEGFDLFRKKYQFLYPLRSLGIRAINLKPQADNASQIYLFEDVADSVKRQKIDEEMDTLKTRFGKGCICRGAILGEPDPEGQEKPFSMMYK